MFKRLMAAGAALACMTLAACATYSPPSGGPTAVVKIQRTDLADELGGDHAKLLFSPDATYAKRQEMSASIVFTYDEPHVIPAGTRVHIEAETRHTAGGMFGYTDYYCSIYASWIPEAGHTYDYIPKLGGPRGCEARVIDTATGQAPASLTFEDGPARN